MPTMSNRKEILQANDGTKLNDGSLATEESLLEAGYRKYTGQGVDVYYNADVCEHVGNCVFSNPEIYEVGRRPWIIVDNADQAENVRVVGNCPTGALKLVYKEG